MPVLIIAALMSETILQTMKPGLASFRAGGKTVLMFVTLAMPCDQPDMVRSTPEEEVEGRNSIAIITPTIPLLVDPGTILVLSLLKCIDETSSIMA